MVTFSNDFMLNAIGQKKQMMYTATRAALSRGATVLVGEDSASNELTR